MICESKNNIIWCILATETLVDLKLSCRPLIVITYYLTMYEPPMAVTVKIRMTEWDQWWCIHCQLRLVCWDTTKLQTMFLFIIL